MLLTKEQIEAAKKGQNPNGVGGARGLSKYGKWPGGIVYYTIDTRKQNLKDHKANGIFSSVVFTKQLFIEIPLECMDAQGIPYHSSL